MILAGQIVLPNILTYDYQKDKNNKDKSKAIHVMGHEEV